MLQSASIAITGDATGYIGSRIRGRILTIKCVADNTIDDNFDIAITGETTGIPILTDAAVTKNTTTWWHPRALANHNDDGAAATDVCVEVPVVNERLKLVQSNATAGVATWTVIYDSEE